MKKLNVNQRKWLISAHVVFAALWTGTVLSMALIAWTNRIATNGSELYALDSAINLLDDYIVIPAAIGSLLTGGLLSWLTTWGFTKYYWVIVKWLLTIALIVFGTFWLYPWSNAAESLAAAEQLQALENPLYLLDAKAVIIGAIAQTICLFATIAISVLKPWGRRKASEKAEAA